MARYINEAKAERSAAEAELAIVDRDRPPTAAELFAVIEELREDLAALAAADDPADKAETYRRPGVPGRAARVCGRDRTGAAEVQRGGDETAGLSSMATHPSSAVLWAASAQPGGQPST